MTTMGRPAEGGKRKDSNLSPPQSLQPISLAQVQYDAFGRGLSMAEICSQFTNGSGSEFYSPMYPSNYLNNTDCYKVIQAGTGQCIRLRFLDHFHIEYSENCEYDYLEIRDGQFGYSTLIQKICGTSPPTVIQSAGRHLWLRFHSDSDIQYIGFKAVYEFIPNPTPPPLIEDCSITCKKLNDSIGSSNISGDLIAKVKNFKEPVDCTWMIEAEEGQRIQLNFEDYDLEKPNDCEHNFIEIYESDDQLTTDRRKKQLCSSMKAVSYESTGNVLYIRFYSHIDMKAANPDLKSRFLAYYNFFREKSPMAPCQAPAEHDCSDNTCISATLLCNGKNDCKLRNDEENCQRGDTGEKRTDIAMIASLGCVLIIGMCGGLFLNIYRKLQRDRSEILELKDALQKSRESMMTAHQSVSGATQMYSPQTYGSSPQISSHESADSKETVLEKNQLTQKRHSNGTGARSVAANEFDNGNGDATNDDAETLPREPSTKPSAPPTMISQASGPSQGGKGKTFNGDTRKPLRVQAEITQNATVYSPPPPYPTSIPRSSFQNRTNDPRKEFLAPKEEPDGEPTELCIEVRDSACQTRESFLAQLAQKQGREQSNLRKAPLARGEAVDTFDVSTSMPKRAARIPRLHDFPSNMSVVSTSSTGTDRMGASLGSLENIDEYQE